MNFSMTTRVYLGSSCASSAFKKEAETFGKKTLLITTGRSLKRLGYIDDIVSLLKNLSVEVCVYDQITANPDVAEIRKAIKLGKQCNISSVIGFGGGSAIDAAKATAVGVVSDVDIEEYLLYSNSIILPENTLPIIAIPTTAGTGAELTKGAIISSREKGIKAGIRGEEIIPTAAIINPAYTFSCPMNVTMEAGFDVFAHAAESYCSVKANPLSETLSEKAIKIVGEALPRLNKDLNDEEAREMMSFASHIMGYNVRDIGNCLPHRLQYPIGITTETSHGAGLIALYPAWIKYEHTVNAERIDRILKWLGCDNDDLTPEDCMKTWLIKLNIQRSIKDLANNIGNEICSNISSNIDAEKLANMVTGNLQNDKLYNLYNLSGVDNIITKLYAESM